MPIELQQSEEVLSAPLHARNKKIIMYDNIFILGFHSDVSAVLPLCDKHPVQNEKKYGVGTYIKREPSCFIQWFLVSIGTLIMSFCLN